MPFRIVVGGWVKFSNGCWTSCLGLKSTPSRSPSGRASPGVSSGRGGTGPPCVARSPKPGEPIVDVSEKYPGKCPTDRTVSLGTSFDGGVPSVVCEGYLSISLDSVKRGRSPLTLFGWKNLMCDSRYAGDEKPLPQSYSLQKTRPDSVPIAPEMARSSLF